MFYPRCFRGLLRISDLIFSLSQEVKTNKALASLKYSVRRRILVGRCGAPKIYEPFWRGSKQRLINITNSRLGLSVILSRFEIAGAHR